MNTRDSKWNYQFEKLRDYVKYHNTFPTHSNELGLSSWIKYQRVLKKKGALSADKIKKLNALSFVWSLQEQRWQMQFIELKSFISQVGRFPAIKTTQSDLINEKSLAGWCMRQRSTYKKGLLSQARFKSLSAIKFNWEAHDFLWAEYFELLCMYYKKYQRWPKSREIFKHSYLGRWCNTQRIHYRKGCLEKKKIERLESIDFVWDPRQQKWQRFFKLLLAFKAQYGRWPNRSECYQGEKLGQWVMQQRQLDFEKFSPLKKKCLDLINFNLEPARVSRLERWNQHFNAYIKYRNENKKEPRVLVTYEGLKLGQWCSLQRKARKMGRLDKQKIDKLNDVNFVWNQYVTWDKKFKELQAFVHKYQRFPKQHESSDSSSLGMWCKLQHVKAKKNQLTLQQSNALASLKPYSNRHYDVFARRLAGLKEFYDRHSKWPASTSNDLEEKKLGKFCERQRYARRTNAISHEKIKALSAIGFVWNLRLKK